MYVAKLVDGKSTEPIDKTDGYCPCKLVKTKDSFCICKEFRDLLNYLNADSTQQLFDVPKDKLDEFDKLISKNGSKTGIKCKCGIYETHLES